MSDTPPDTRSERRRHGMSWRHRLNTAEGLRSILRQIAILPTLAVLLLIALSDYLLRTEPPWSVTRWLVWTVGATACAAVLMVAWRLGGTTADAVHHQRSADVKAVEQQRFADVEAVHRQWATERRAVEQQRATDIQAVNQWIARLQSVLADGLKDVRQTLDQLQRGERPHVHEVPSEPVASHMFAVLEHDLHVFVSGVQSSVAEASAQQERAAVLSIARRMLTLLNQMLKSFDELEREMEDPEFLRPVFRLDHMATRLRRLVESISVVGGGVPRRSNKPVKLSDVINHAIGEVEQYGRVKIASPVDGIVEGQAAAGLIHLLAELIDNAANFSDPKTQVLIRVEKATSGMVVQIDDRGKLMPDEVRNRLNNLLSDPSPHSAGEHLRDGRIGIFVVADYARRLGLHIRLQSNQYFSNQAEVVVPFGLFRTDAAGQRQVAHSGCPSLVPAPALGLTAGPAASASPAHARADARTGIPVGPRQTATRDAGPSAPTTRAADGASPLPVRRSGTPQASPGLAASGAPDSPDGAPSPLPVRNTSHSYLADGLQNSTSVRREPAAPADPTLVSRVAEGKRRASAHGDVPDKNPSAEPTNPPHPLEAPHGNSTA
ncbi:ATP-binding protein [Streptomyces sp. NPDC050704]|uniref:sensor histidine kinase n=1 Tax=Streptomyces sp. NPDC050704 TaxID=3157219 RepID=UPI003414B439